MKTQLEKLMTDLKKLANPEKAMLLQRFFKTGPGEYGEGDIFLGITVPEQRKVAKKFTDLNLNDVQELLSSKIHEYRLVGLLILIEKYKKEGRKIVDFYLANTMNINNWDLVDLSSHKILGDYLLDKDRSVLYSLAKSSNVWERRISVISTFAFIKHNDFEDSLKLGEILLSDTHDLIHKAVGWMLREIGKRDKKVEEAFLKKYYRQMPRTMLRYAIEKFNKNKREFYLKT